MIVEKFNINENLLNNVLRVKAESDIVYEPKIATQVQSTVYPDETISMAEWFMYIKTRKINLEV